MFDFIQETERDNLDTISFEDSEFWNKPILTMLVIFDLSDKKIIELIIELLKIVELFFLLYFLLCQDFSFVYKCLLLLWTT